MRVDQVTSAKPARPQTAKPGKKKKLTSALSPGRGASKEKSSMSLIRDYEAQIQNLSKKRKNRSMEKGGKHGSTSNLSKTGKSSTSTSKGATLEVQNKLAGILDEAKWKFSEIGNVDRRNLRPDEIENLEATKRKYERMLNEALE